MLKTLNIENFTCFPKAELTFSKGLNVIVGENGTGKSHLLKLGYTVLYTMYEFKEKKDERRFFKIKIGGEVKEKEFSQDVNDKIMNAFFSVLEKNFKASVFNDLLPKYDVEINGLGLDATFAENGMFSVSVLTYMDGISEDELYIEYGPEVDVNITEFNFSEIANVPIFFPVKEIISIYEGFGASLRKRELGFNKTYLDFYDALALKPLNNIENTAIKEGISLLESSINDFSVESQNDIFYFRKKTNDTKQNSEIVIPANLFAEGHNKLGTLSYLMRNGSIQEGMTLFWDEPEANMNPRLLKVLAKILVEMSSHMQIIISTHSLFLLRELEILQEKKELKEAKFFGLHFREDGMGVEVTQGNTSNDIGNIVALDENLYQADRYLAVQVEGLDD